jgi:hypothetical protein
MLLFFSKMQQNKQHNLLLAENHLRKEETDNWLTVAVLQPLQ